MNCRPWLETLKETIKEDVADTDMPLEEPSETLLSQGCERFESLADHSPPIMDIPTTPAQRGEDERRLLAALWKPKERCGKTIWQSPGNGWYAQEMAQRLSESEGR